VAASRTACCKYCIVRTISFRPYSNGNASGIMLLSRGANLLIPRFMLMHFSHYPATFTSHLVSTALKSGQTVNSEVKVE